MDDISLLAESFLTGNDPVNTALLMAKARKLSCNSTLVANTGNAVTLFAMLVLQRILAQQSLNPISNLSNIIAISTAIAELNTSITVLDII